MPRCRRLPARRRLRCGKHARQAFGKRGSLQLQTAVPPPGDSRGRLRHELSLRPCFPPRSSRSTESTLVHRRLRVRGRHAWARSCRGGRRGGRRGRALHAHGARRGTAGRLPIRRGDRARRLGDRARTQSRAHQPRSDRAWRDGRDPEVSRRSRPGGAARQHALHVGRAVRDVHGRHHLVPCSAGWYSPRRWRSSPPGSTRS